MNWPIFWIEWRTLYFSSAAQTFWYVNMKNSLTPKSQKMFDSILVTLLKTRPHYSQSSLENATPSSGTSPLASYKAVPQPPPPPPGQIVDFSAEMVAYQKIVLCGHITSLLNVTTMTTKRENEQIKQKPRKGSTFAIFDVLISSVIPIQRINHLKYTVPASQL